MSAFGVQSWFFWHFKFHENRQQNRGMCLDRFATVTHKVLIFVSSGNSYVVREYVAITGEAG